MNRAVLSKVNRKPNGLKILPTVKSPAALRPQQYDFEDPLISHLHTLLTQNELPARFSPDTRIVILPVLVIASDLPIDTRQGQMRSKDDRPPRSSFKEIGRPTKIEPKTSRYVYGKLTLDASRHEVLVDHRAIDLTPKEFSLLEYFLKHPGLVRTREMVLNAVWGYDYYGTTRTVDVHIRRLKHKIPFLASSITCIHSLGYKLRESNPTG